MPYHNRSQSTINIREKQSYKDIDVNFQFQGKATAKLNICRRQIPKKKTRSAGLKVYSFVLLMAS